MKASIATVLALSGAAWGQLNYGFEQGDLTGYALNGVDASRSQVVQSGPDGMMPHLGSYFLQMSAGELSQAQAAQVLGIPAERLGTLYLQLGGEAGLETAGDYNVLSTDVPPGDYKLKFQFKTQDAVSPYVDHAFVVNGAGQITVLADALDGEVESWTDASVTHPGGEIFLVAANGGDTLFDAQLFVDTTFVADTDNGSFESNSFNHWTIHDDGAGGAFVTNEFIDGLVSPHGTYYARLPAGNVAQADAEAIMGLEPGRLAALYTELGGTGNATAGDYLIISQGFGGSTISLDFAFKSQDAGSTTNLDHAFVVDSEGNITVLDTTIDLGMTPTWDQISVDHTGGEFFIVSANGGGTGNNATLYVDGVSEGPASFDSAPAWNGESHSSNFGGIYAETMGQRIVPAERSMLERVKFFLYEQDSSKTFGYQVFVYEWDGAKIFGDALYQSPMYMTDGADGAELVVVETPGVLLEKNKCYVAFLTTTTSAPTPHYGYVATTDDVIPGMMLFHGTDEFDELFDGGWLQSPNTDLAFKAEMAPYESQVVPNVNLYAPGPSHNIYPWSYGGDFRYQQLYAAQQFNGRGGLIDSFAYRTQFLGESFEPLDIDVQIWMGYSYANPGELSITFDDNWAFGKTLVYDGPMTLSSAGLGGFDVIVDVNDVFQYQPDVGHLLVEIVFPNDGQPELPALDSGGYGYAMGGTPWMDRVLATSADGQNGFLGGDDGHVTKFNFIMDPPAYDPDCNGDGTLSILDFVCFQIAFQAGDLEIADCDANGTLNILDFVCFQEAFLAACN